MDAIKQNELNEQLLSLINGGSLGEGQKAVLDTVVPLYLQSHPDCTLDDFLNIFRNPNPEFHMSPASEEDISEVRDYIAHYWE